MSRALACSARLTACAIVMLGLPLGAYAGTKAVIGQKAADGSVTFYSQRFHAELQDGSRVAELDVRTVDGYLQLTRKSYPGGECRMETAPIVDTLGNPVQAGASSDPKTLFVVDEEPISLIRCTDAGCKSRSGAPSPGPEPFSVSWCDMTRLSGHECACHEVKSGAIRVRTGAECKRTPVVEIPMVLIDWVLGAYIINDY
jgi:hypothetical protein